MARQAKRDRVMVTLHDGQCLEIHDDLLARAFRDYAADLRDMHKTATALAHLVRASQPVLEYVIHGGDSAPTERAASCLETGRALLKKIGSTDG